MRTRGDDDSALSAYEKNARAQKARRVRLGAAGLCIICGRNPSDAPRLSCLPCLEKAREWRRRLALERGGRARVLRKFRCEWCGGLGHSMSRCEFALRGERRLDPDLEARVGGLP